MQNESRVPGLSPFALLVAAAAMVKLALHLPHAVSGHMNYYLCGEMDFKAVVKNDFSMPFNANMIFVCRNPLTSPGNIWSHLKNY